MVASLVLEGVIALVAAGLSKLTEWATNNVIDLKNEAYKSRFVAVEEALRLMTRRLESSSMSDEDALLLKPLVRSVLDMAYTTGEGAFFTTGGNLNCIMSAINSVRLEMLYIDRKHRDETLESMESMEARVEKLEEDHKVSEDDDEKKRLAAEINTLNEYFFKVELLKQQVEKTEKDLEEAQATLEAAKEQGATENEELKENMEILSKRFEEEKVAYEQRVQENTKKMKEEELRGAVRQHSGAVIGALMALLPGDTEHNHYFAFDVLQPRLMGIYKVYWRDFPLLIEQVVNMLRNFRPFLEQEQDRNGIKVNRNLWGMVIQAAGCDEPTMTVWGYVLNVFRYAEARRDKTLPGHPAGPNKLEWAAIQTAAEPAQLALLEYVDFCRR